MAMGKGFQADWIGEPRGEQASARGDGLLRHGRRLRAQRRVSRRLRKRAQVLREALGRAVRGDLHVEPGHLERPLEVAWLAFMYSNSGLTSAASAQRVKTPSRAAASASPPERIAAWPRRRRTIRSRGSARRSPEQYVT